MANKDIQTFEYSISTPDGPKKVYQVKVVDPETGDVKSSIQTSDYNEAQKFYDEQTIDFSSDATVNGGPPPANSPLTSDQAIGTPPGAEFAPSGPMGAANPGMQEMKKADPDLLGRSPHSEQNIKFTANIQKKPVDCGGMPRDLTVMCELPLEDKNKRGISGAFGGKRIQAMVNRVTCDSEWVKRGPDNNAFIVIGNDRPGTKDTGYGGGGHTQCDSVDIVAGLGGFAPVQASLEGEKRYTNPNFLLDSARIYISQKTDVDKNFEIGLKEGMQIKSEAKSAVAIKADNVRLIGRESLVLTTNTDAFNSQGGQIQAWSGIYLMANNNEEGLQPIPVGNKLASCVYELSKHVESLGKIFHGYLKYQMKFNQAVSNHTHVSPFYARPTLPSQQCQAAGMLVDVEHLSKTELSILKHLTNLSGFRNNYLTMKGDKYINSRFNKTN